MIHGKMEEVVVEGLGRCMELRGSCSRRHFGPSGDGDVSYLWPWLNGWKEVLKAGIPNMLLTLAFHLGHIPW